LHTAEIYTTNCILSCSNNDLSYLIIEVVNVLYF
jgi:hypothetical protein